MKTERERRLEARQAHIPTKPKGSRTKHKSKQGPNKPPQLTSNQLDRLPEPKLVHQSSYSRASKPDQKRITHSPPLKHTFTFGVARLLESDEDEEGSLYGEESGYKHKHKTSVCSKTHWTSEEDKQLKNAVERYDSKNWKKISEQLEGRSEVQCLH